MKIATYSILIVIAIVIAGTVFWLASDKPSTDKTEQVVVPPKDEKDIVENKTTTCVSDSDCFVVSSSRCQCSSQIVVNKDYISSPSVDQDKIICEDNYCYLDESRDSDNSECSEQCGVPFSRVADAKCEAGTCIAICRSNTDDQIVSCSSN